LASCSGPEQTPDKTIQSVIAFLGQWPVTISALLFAYVLGSMLRAFPVSPADNLCCGARDRISSLLKLKRPTGWRAAALSSRFFPYPKMLEIVQRALIEAENGSEPLALKIGDGDNLIASFDYWKLVLCQRAPALFAICQAQEARVRYFVGLFWAGCIGVALGLVSMLLSTSAWFWPEAAVTSISVLFATVFGMRLRYIRAEEAQTVFCAYVAYLVHGAVQGRDE
jgi:hypothetical protein